MPCADIIDFAEPATASAWQSANSAWCGRRQSSLSEFAGAPARRRLFGACSSQEVREYVRRELAAIQQRDCRRYNFDFERMTPLPGRFQWQLAGSSEHVGDDSSPPSLVTPDAGGFDDAVPVSRASTVAVKIASRAPVKARRRSLHGQSEDAASHCTVVRSGGCLCGEGLASSGGSRSPSSRYCRACGAFLYRVCDAQTSPPPASYVPSPPGNVASCRGRLYTSTPSTSSPSAAVSSTSGGAARTRTIVSKSRDSDSTLSASAQQLKITDYFRCRKRSAVVAKSLSDDSAASINMRRRASPDSLVTSRSSTSSSSSLSRNSCVTCSHQSAVE